MPEPDGPRSARQPLGQHARWVILLAVVVWAVAAAFLGLHLATPSGGARLAPGQPAVLLEGVVVTPLVAQPGGLLAGDVVTAVAGRSLEAWAAALLDTRAARPQWRFGQTVTYDVIRAGQPLAVTVTLGRYPLGAIVAREWGAIVFALLNQLICLLIFYRRPNHRPAQALFLTSVGVLGSTTWSLGLTVADLVGAAGFWLFKASTFGAYMLIMIGALHFALVFPQPRLRVEHSRWIVPGLYAGPYIVHAIYMAYTRSVAASSLDWLRRMDMDVGVLQGIYLLLTIGAMWQAYRAARDPISRLQFRWVMYAFVVTVVAALGLGTLPEILTGYPLASWNVVALVGLLVPVALAFAILRYRLFDIDVLINRTLVYGALTMAVAGLYVLIVGALGMVLQARGGLTPTLLATGVAAVLFQPLRERLQRGVNRMMYGERDEPVAVLARLGQRLEATLVPEAVLPTIVETIAQALKLPYAAIVATEAGEARTAAEYGLHPPASPPLRLPLVYQGEAIGELVVAPRGPTEAFTPAERRLLGSLARQAGVAAHAVRLTADLQHSRERLVTAREEERRRLRRDLHDGLGPALAAQALKLGSARAVLGTSPERAESLLLQAEGDIASALADVRRLVYDLRPPALDELGLAGAIRAASAGYSAGGTLEASVEAPERLPPLPAAVEVAAYRITQEALANVARHAQARHCRVRLWLDGAPRGALCLEIDDDGRGLAAREARRAGVGLASMRERAAELGGTCTVEALPAGGTRVAAYLPTTLNGDR